MALPKVPNVIFELDVPGFDQKIQYRTFLVKEFKALLQAREFSDDIRFR
jgi:hypothetical protein